MANVIKECIGIPQGSMFGPANIDTWMEWYTCMRNVGVLASINMLITHHVFWILTQKLQKEIVKNYRYHVTDTAIVVPRKYQLGINFQKAC